MHAAPAVFLRSQLTFWSDEQVDVHVLSWDRSADLEVLAINAASAALACSGLPWQGPVAAVRLAWSAEGDIVPHPSHQQLAEAGGSLLYVGNANGVILLDAEVCGTHSVDPLLMWCWNSLRSADSVQTTELGPVQHLLVSSKLYGATTALPVTTSDFKHAQALIANLRAPTSGVPSGRPYPSPRVSGLTACKNVCVSLLAGRRESRRRAAAVQGPVRGQG